MGQGRRQIFTGVIVNRVLGLSRQERRRLRARIHQLRKQNTGDIPLTTRPIIQGKVAYLSMLNPQQAAPFSAAGAPSA